MFDSSMESMNSNNANTNVNANTNTNTNANGSTARMGNDTPSITPSSGYGSDSWTSMSPYSQSPYSQSPLTEHGGFFASFVPPGLPSESIGRMHPPPPQTHQMMQSTPIAHPQLPLLNTTWPSQLTNPSPSTSGSYSAPPVSMTPLASAAPIEPHPLPPGTTATPNTSTTTKGSTQQEKSRKTLTAEQKRQMCQFHEDNPGTRQADIGARFGVERSTVSKVLRQRDQYLKREQEPDHSAAAAAAKRAKSKHPDFDRTLSNYVRRQQQRGFEVSDDEILEQARRFAHVSGNQEALIGNLTGSWLQKFKQKHGLGTGAGKLTRRASETNIPDSARLGKNRARGERGAERGSSGGMKSESLSPAEGSRSDEELRPDGISYEFDYKQPSHAHSHSQPQTHSHSHSHSQSAVSLATSDLRDATTSSFSASTISPTTSFTFSPDPNVGSFPMPPHHTSDFLSREKRSNTCPSLTIDYLNHPTTEPLTPRHPSSSTAPSALDSPAHELQLAPFGIDALTSPPTLRRSSSNSSMNARSSNSSSTGALASTPLDSSPVSPSQEDARRAAKTLLNYIQNAGGNFEHSEYMTIVQLTKKLQLQQHQMGRPAIGHLSRIPEGDVELPMIHTKMESA